MERITAAPVVGKDGKLLFVKAVHGEGDDGLVIEFQGGAVGFLTRRNNPDYAALAGQDALCLGPSHAPGGGYGEAGPPGF